MKVKKISGCYDLIAMNGSEYKQFLEDPSAKGWIMHFNKVRPECVTFGASMLERVVNNNNWPISKPINLGQLQDFLQNPFACDDETRMNVLIASLIMKNSVNMTTRYDGWFEQMILLLVESLPVIQEDIIVVVPDRKMLREFEKNGYENPLSYAKNRGVKWCTNHAGVRIQVSYRDYSNSIKLFAYYNDMDTTFDVEHESQQEAYLYILVDIAQFPNGSLYMEQLFNNPQSFDSNLSIKAGLDQIKHKLENRSSFKHKNRIVMHVFTTESILSTRALWLEDKQHRSQWQEPNPAVQPALRQEPIIAQQPVVRNPTIQELKLQQDELAAKIAQEQRRIAAENDIVNKNRNTLETMLMNIARQKNEEMLRGNMLLCENCGHEVRRKDIHIKEERILKVMGESDEKIIDWSCKDVDSINLDDLIAKYRLKLLSEKQ